MTSCCENNLLLNQKDALERLANTIKNMPENDFILEFPITKIDDVKKVRVILRKTKDDYNFVITQESCNKELYRRIWNSDVFLSNFMLTQRFFFAPLGYALGLRSQQGLVRPNFTRILGKSNREIQQKFPPNYIGGDLTKLRMINTVFIIRSFV